MRLKQIVFILALVPMIVPIGVMGINHDVGCASCHTPHHAGDLPGVPLWNGAETAKTFTPYSSDTLDATVGQPDGPSKLCLSCHDGSLGVLAGGSMDFGSDLSTSHPISFTYDGALAITDPGLKDPGSASTLGGTIAEDVLDSTSKVQCTSCHDIHDTGVGTSYLRGYDYFVGGGGSELCRMCHLK